VSVAARRRTIARRRLAAVAALVTVVALVVAVLHSGQAPRRLLPGAGNTETTFDPLAFDPDRAEAFERAASAGVAHVLYARSPGGALATAARVGRYRALIEDLADGSGIDPRALEALVFLESAGRPDAVAGTSVRAAAGLTQIVAETGRNLLGMGIDLGRSARLTRRIARARRAGRAREVARLETARRRADPRFDPPRALAATLRYLAIARGRLGREDFTLAAYHMGIGNLETALRRYADDEDTPIRELIDDEDLTYARLYFDSTPLRHASAHALLTRLGDDSANYLWKLRAAARIMDLWRSDPGALRRLAALQTAKNSAEEVLHPRGRTEAFRDPAALRAAWDDGRVVGLPGAPGRLGFRVDATMGSLAGRIGQSRSLYRGLRPEARALLAYLAAGVRAISGTRAALVVTSTVRDQRYQRLLVAHEREATRRYSLHTTGWAFDVLRAYASPAQARAFQFLLDRLQALNLIAWVREPAAIHVTVASGAGRALGAERP
jgi:hypothetical protein